MGNDDSIVEMDSSKMMSDSRSLFAAEQEGRVSKYVKSKGTFGDPYHYVNRMLSKARGYGSVAGRAKTEKMQNAKNEMMASNFARKLARTHGITVREYHKLDQRGKDAKYVAHQKQQKKLVASVKQPVKNLVAVNGVSDGTSVVDAVRVGVIKRDEVKKKMVAMADYASVRENVVKKVGVNFGGEVVYPYSQMTAYQKHLKKTQKMTYEEKEESYKKFWQKWKNDETNVVINTSGFGNYFGKDTFSVAPITETLKVSTGAHNTKILTKSHGEVGTTLGIATFNEALNDIKNTLGKNGKVILLGHSFGGDSVIELAKKLEKEKIEVELLVTVDAVGVGEGKFPIYESLGTETKTIPRNVKNHLNFWENMGLSPKDKRILWRNVRGQDKFSYKNQNTLITNIESSILHTKMLPNKVIESKIIRTILNHLK